MTQESTVEDVGKNRPPTLSSRPPPSSLPPPHAAAGAIGKRPRMSGFLRVLVAITAAIHLPFGVAVFEVCRRAGLSSTAAWISAVASCVVGVFFFVGRAKKVMNDAPRSFASTFLVDLPYYIHWSACVFCLVPSIVYLLLEPLVDLARDAPVGPHAGFFVWTYVAGLFVCAYGVTFRRWFFQTKRVDVHIENLDPRFDGYTIAQLSDLHIGAYTPLWWAERWVVAANAAKPDLAVITGDMVTSGTAFHEDIATLLGGLESKDGVFACMGNHDYFGEGEPLVSLLEGRGVRVLRNEGKTITRDGASFYLASIDDTWTRRANLEKALEARPEGMPTVLLSHDPERFVHAAKAKVDLVLSGHTHGGQIALPFFARHVNASKLAHHYHLGVYKKGRTTLYVHPGLGTTGPPIRVGVAPAVVLITLRAKGP